MKDEEMAEQYAQNLEKELMKEYEEHSEYGQTAYLATIPTLHAKQAFLAGLKAGRPQWHDLEEDPTDLPEEPNEKMRVNETWVYVKFFDNTYGLVDKGALNNYSGAIAWCELPTFDKE